MLDKLTYAGNRAEPRGRRARVPPGRHRRPGRGRARGRGLRRDRQLRRRDARRPLDPRAGRVHPHRRARHAGAARPRAPRTASGSSRSRPTRCTATSRSTRRRAPRTRRSARRARTRRRRPAATCRCSPTSAPTASTRCVTRGANTYGPRQYPEKFLPLFITNAFDGEQLPVYGDGRQRREWLHVDDHCAGDRARAARGAGGRGLQRRRPGAREHGGRAADPRPDRRVARPRPPRRRPARPRPPLRRRLVEAARARLDARSTRSTRGGLEETVDWYRENRDWWEPIKSGEYRALLRAAVRDAPRGLGGSSGRDRDLPIAAVSSGAGRRSVMLRRVRIAAARDRRGRARRSPSPQV